MESKTLSFFLLLVVIIATVNSIPFEEGPKFRRIARQYFPGGGYGGYPGYGGLGLGGSQFTSSNANAVASSNNFGGGFGGFGGSNAAASAGTNSFGIGKK